MGFVAYRDNNYELCEATVKKSYKELRNQILLSKKDLTCYSEVDNEVFGYEVSSNEPLTKLYEEDYYVVKFVFSNIETIHKPSFEIILIDLLKKLQEHIKENKGYYNLRIPSHIVDLIRAYNFVFSDGCFCGGTVEEFISKSEVELILKDGMKMFFCNEKYIVDNREELLNITYNSFKTYQGQYHIAKSTEEKAGLIYKNWIQSEFDFYRPNSILVAEYNGVACGFVTIGEGETYVEGKLAAVSDKFRGLGTYRSMIAFLINYAFNKQKNFLSSTQFDNLTVQGAWARLGLRPFYSIYNFHIDNR